jgi:hypothetical protein
MKGAYFDTSNGIIFNSTQRPSCGAEFLPLLLWGAHNPLIRRYFLGVFRFAVLPKWRWPTPEPDLRQQ